MNYEQEESQQLRKYTKQLIIDSYFLRRPIHPKKTLLEKKGNNNDVIQENIHETTRRRHGGYVRIPSGPNEDVIMGNAWMFRDNGTVQLQFAAGSIPVPAVESARIQGNDLRVTMASNDGPATMDLRLHQFVLTPPQGVDAGAVESVTLVVNGEKYPAERAENLIIQTSP